MKPIPEYYPDNTIKVSTLIDGDLVVQHLDAMGVVTKRVVDVAALQFDENIRAKLIELGWTPPKEAAHD